MATYIVVHHQKDPDKPWSNSWLDDDRIEAITTNKQVAERCLDALATNQAVYVHRCGYGAETPAICCSARIASVDKLGGSDWLVRFTQHQPLRLAPSLQPLKGQNSYEF